MRFINQWTEKMTMKKLIEHKELIADEVKHSMLPIKNCLFWLVDKNEPTKGTLTDICAGEFPFKRKEVGVYKHCAKPVERYPTDVPEEVQPLPEDKPFLAYVGQYPLPDSTGLKPGLYMLGFQQY